MFQPLRLLPVTLRIFSGSWPLVKSVLVLVGLQAADAAEDLPACRLM